LTAFSNKRFFKLLSEDILQASNTDIIICNVDATDSMAQHCPVIKLKPSVLSDIFFIPACIMEVHTNQIMS